MYLQLTWYQYPKFRLWRKNAQSFGEHSCAGVDLNRNFGVSNWNQVCTLCNGLLHTQEVKRLVCMSAAAVVSGSSKKNCQSDS